MTLLSLLSVRSELASPVISPDEEQLFLQPNSLINISCTGEQDVTWVEPLPEDATVVPGVLSSTLLIYNATVEHTRYYECIYANQEIEQDDEMPKNVAFIYVFVQGKHILEGSKVAAE